MSCNQFPTKVDAVNYKKNTKIKNEFLSLDSYYTQETDKNGNQQKTLQSVVCDKNNEKVLDRPVYNSKAYGRQTIDNCGKWVSLGYEIIYESLCGESFMECGEADAHCGKYTKFKVAT